MSGLTVHDFTEFFEALHGVGPFPWQSMLLERIVEVGWPDLIDLPTASGKTACIDVATFALAMGARTPRRIWFVVDRRIVVDEAQKRAALIAEELAKARHGILHDVSRRLKMLGGVAPLQVARLRGGAPREIRWTGNPAQPAVITSTVDQFGSRLLFRGYGVSDGAKPIHAALAANDSLVILDEAHLAEPFCQTVRAVERFQREPWAKQPISTPFKLVVMSATLSNAEEEHLARFPKKDERERSLNHPKLIERRSAPKPTELALAKKPKLTKEIDALKADELVLDAAYRAVELARSGHMRIAVMVNRVATARQIVAQLRIYVETKLADARIVLLTGRLRPLDRDQLVDEWSPKLKAGSKEALNEPIILVTTQCLEVGADFSFDALITECASLDALRQRFGRLSRLGEFPNARGVILMRKSDVKSDEKLDDDHPQDPIYGNAIVRTWALLTADGAPSIEMGIDALAAQLPANLSRFQAPRREAPLLMPAYLDLLSQTSPRPAIEPDVSLFLHGIPKPDERSRMQFRVVWRNELSGIVQGERWLDVIGATKPLSAEILTVPYHELRAVLLGRSPDGQDDVEGGFEPAQEERRQDDVSSIRMCVWRGDEQSIAGEQFGRLKPDDIIVFPANHPTFRLLLPDMTFPADVYDLASSESRGTMHVRYPAALGPLQPSSSLGTDGEDFDVESALQLVRDEITRRSEHDAYFRKLGGWIERLKNDEKPRVSRYFDEPACWSIIARSKPEPIDTWVSDIDDEQTLQDPGGERTLEKHTERVVTAARRLAGLLLPQHEPAIEIAARLHDLGKADARFQAYLAGRSRASSGPLLAKSDSRRTPWQDRKLRELLGLPQGFRHELLSMLLAETDPSVAATELCPLMLHLIATHHGRARPFPGVVSDPEPPDVSVCGLSMSGKQRCERPAHRLDSGIAERFWHLTRAHGWWGLAYMEAILRCADTHASAYAEQEGQP